MTGYAIHSPQQSNSATVIKPLLFANDLLVKNSRSKVFTAVNTQAMQSAVEFEKIQQLMNSFKTAMYGLDMMEADALYATREQQAQQAEDLSLLVSFSTTLMESGEKLAKSNQARGASESEVLVFRDVYNKFSAFYARLQEVHQLIDHLASTPDPDEDSPEFGQFLITLGETC